MKSTPLFTPAVKWLASDLVRASYRALLGREPDPDGLAAYWKDLRRTGNLEAIIRDIAGSSEHWDQLVQMHAAELIAAVFRGLLGRKPDPIAVTTYMTVLADRKDLADLVGVVGRSQEHWERVLAGNAPELLRAVYLSLTGREPDDQALASHAEQMASGTSLASILQTLGDSEEHRRYLSQRNAQYSRHPVEALHDPAWVFIHVYKTAGTSIQNMLIDAMGMAKVYREHDDNLYLRNPAELADYSVFVGHFNYDSLAFVPRRTLRILSFLRAPRSRLISNYQFLRAHEPSSPNYDALAESANRLSIGEFFADDSVRSNRSVWNHMSWCLMGNQWWTEHRQLLLGSGAAGHSEVLAAARQEMRTRLEEFAFIGLQEDFSRSCEILFGMMGVPMPAIRKDHTIPQLARRSSHLKLVEAVTLAPADAGKMDGLMELDSVLYEEAVALYKQRHADVRAGEPGALS